MHHVSLRTADIHRAIAFYEALGFAITERFTAGITLACWLEGWQGRIELLQVPEPKPAPDPFGDEHYVGYYHLSLDLARSPDQPTEATEPRLTIPTWLSLLGDRLAPQPLKVLLRPQQQMIGRGIYEVVFIADPDGMPIEILQWQTNLPINLPSA
ncbi:MAG: VOC family protein [Oscillatoriales cyanobacterium]|nr:MAG: VOC family protein [Oscillatoriales cyanobacterium]